MVDIVADPFTQLEAPVGYSGVIDVGGPSNIDPSAAPGAPGSGLIESRVGGPATANPAPPPVPVSQTVTQMLEDTAPGAGAKTASADPFVTLEKQAAAAATPPVAPLAPAPEHAGALQPIKDAVQSVMQSLTTTPPEGSGPLSTPQKFPATQVLQHGFTLGLDEIIAPLIPAIAESVATGKPFSEVYDKVVKQMREPRTDFEKDLPYAATALSVAGGVASPLNRVFSPLFSGAPAATILGKVANAGRNIAAGTASGAATGFTMANGDIGERLQGAKEGAEVGGVLSTVAPVIATTATNLRRMVRPGAAVDPIAGQALRESAGLTPTQPVPPRTPSPLPGVPVGTAAEFNNPGLAARERVINATDDAGRQAQIAAQTAGVRQAATTPQPGGARLATATATTPEASASVVTGLQKARAVLDAEEERLWTKPSLTSLRNDVLAIQSKVGQALAALPLRFQAAIRRTADIQNALEDLRNLPATASLADVNRIRSEILELGRSLPFEERFARKGVDAVARAILDGIESNPALRNNPQALADYQRARAFTFRMHDVLGTRAFQRMLQATEGNKKGLDAGTLAGQLFNFGKGTEINPGSVARVTQMLDDVRRQWGALQTGNAGVPLPGLSPTAAFAARAELAQGARDFIVHSMLDAASSNVRDQAGSQRYLMNTLSDWIDTNRPWIARSRLFTQPQLDILDRIRNFSIQAQSGENLRGGTNSATYERLAGHRYIDAFMGPLLGRITGVGAGAAAGALATHLFGEAGIGGMIGMEIGGALAGHTAGTSLLQRFYAQPREALMERLTEAIRDPDIAEDLMRKAGQRLSPKTQAWARSLLATVPAEQMARTIPRPETVQ